MITWKCQLDIYPSLKNMDNWPAINILDIPKTKRKYFNRNRQVITLILNGKSSKEVAHQFNVDPSFVYYLLRRCLSCEEDSEPALTKALIPGTRLTSYIRKLPLSDLSNSNGTSGSFNYLLSTIPGLRDHLDQIISNHIKRTKYSQNLKPKFFHTEFKRYLRERNWPQSKYPFNQDSEAYESARKYFHQRQKELSIPKPKKNKVITFTKTPEIAYQEIQIDSQLQDVNTSVYIDFNGKQLPHRLSRVALYLAKDVATDCILSYKICLTKDPTQLDLLHLLEGIHSPWGELDLVTPGLQYEPGACLPSSLSTEFTKVGLGMVKFDNALSHVSHLVRDYICDVHAATLNLGLPAHPKGRNFVEYAFRIMSEDTHRFASTTGSHPNDPIKESRVNAKSPPLLTLNSFEEIISVLITSHNVRPQVRLGGSSPLQLIQHQMATHLIRLSYDYSLSSNSPFKKRKQVPIKWYRNENGAAFINFLGVRYKGKCLEAVSSVMKNIIIEYDIRDIRNIQALTVNGRKLGVLNADKSWQKFPHSIDTRRRIQKFTRKKRLHGNDPLAGYFNYLMHHKEQPKNNLELIRVYREFELNKQSKLEIETSHNSLSNKQSFLTVKVPKWTPNLHQEYKNNATRM